MKKYQNFLSANFHFLVVKFSVYFNRHVFVMLCYNVDVMRRAIYLVLNPNNAGNVPNSMTVGPATHYADRAMLSWNCIKIKGKN